MFDEPCVLIQYTSFKNELNTAVNLSTLQSESSSALDRSGNLSIGKAASPPVKFPNVDIRMCVRGDVFV